MENISLKRNSDSPIVISSKDDVENILSILKETEPTIENGGIGTPVRVENIINADFISKENVIYRLFLRLCGIGCKGYICISNYASLRMPNIPFSMDNTVSIPLSLEPEVL